MHCSLNFDSRDRVDRGGHRSFTARRRGPEEGCAADSAEHNRTATTGATNGFEAPNRNTAVTPELRAPRYTTSTSRLWQGRALRSTQRCISAADVWARGRCMHFGGNEMAWRLRIDIVWQTGSDLGKVEPKKAFD